MLRNGLIGTLLFLSISVYGELPRTLVKDFNETVVNSDSNPLGFAKYNDKILFFANYTKDGYSLYSYDTNNENTTEIAIIKLGSVTFTANTNNGLLFVDSSSPVGLWASDGTATGTKKIKDLGDVYTRAFGIKSKKLGDSTLLTAYKANGIFLYVTDGTENGTVLLDSYTLEDSLEYDNFVRKVSTFNDNVALYNNGVFYLYDSTGIKTESCSWEQNVTDVFFVNGLIYFQGGDDVGLFSCDLNSNEVTNLGVALSLNLSQIKILFHDENHIFVNNFGDEKILKFSGKELVYSYPLSFNNNDKSALISGKAILSGLREFHVDEQKVTLPEISTNLHLYNEPEECLNGFCFIMYTLDDKNFEYWYAEFGQEQAQKLYTFAGNEFVKQAGKIHNGKLIFSLDTWSSGIEPAILDLQTKELNVIADLNTNFESETSNISDINIFENRLLFNVDSSVGREFWLYDPVLDSSTMVVDSTEINNLDVSPSFSVHNRLYYENQPFSKCLMYDFDQRKTQGAPCNKLADDVIEFSEGYLYKLETGYSGEVSLHYFEKPRYKKNDILLFADKEANWIESIEIYNEKAYIKRSENFLVLDNNDLSMKSYNIPDTETGLAFYYIGKGQWIFSNGIIFDGEKFIETAISQETISPFEQISVRWFLGNSVLFFHESDKYIYDVNNDELTLFENDFHIIKHNQSLYYIDLRTRDFFEYFVETNTSTLKTNIGSQLDTERKFLSNYLYYIENNSFKRINLKTNEITELTKREEYNNIDVRTVVEDDFENVYFAGKIGVFGKELWKIINPNKFAADQNHVIRHDNANVLNFPVSINNKDSVFELLTPTTKGLISQDRNSITFVPHEGSSGSEIILYKFTSQLGESNVGKLNLYINQVPKANPDTIKTVGHHVIFDPTANDIDDFDLYGKNMVIVVPPEYSTFKKEFRSLEKDQGYIGPDSFSYKLVDDEGDSSNVTNVVIDFSSITLNSRPQAIDDKYSLAINTTLVMDILINDVDLDGDTFVPNIDSNPLHGLLTIENEILSYTPDNDFNGIDSFSYSITDEYGQTSDSATVTLEVGSQIINTGNNTESTSGGGGTSGILFVLLCLLYIRPNKLNIIKF